MSNNSQHPENSIIFDEHDRDVTMEQLKFPDNSNACAATQSRSTSLLQSFLDQANDLLLAPTPEFFEQSTLPPTTKDKELLSWLTWGDNSSSCNGQCDHMITPEEINVNSVSFEDEEAEATAVERVSFATMLELDHNNVDGEITTRNWKEKQASASRSYGANCYKENAVGSGTDCSNGRTISSIFNNSDGNDKGLAIPEKRKGLTQKSFGQSDRRKKATIYERKRRERINEKMSNLAKLVPTICKNDDKVLLLDKAIEHIKRLQEHQSRMMSKMSSAVNQNSMMPSMVAAPQFRHQFLNNDSINHYPLNNQISSSGRSFLHHQQMATLAVPPPLVFL